MSVRTLAAALLTALAFSVPVQAGPLPDGLVYLRSVDATIVQEMRYYGPHNFIGRPIDGYYAPECILTRPAAEAIARVNAELKESGLQVKVFDCYRPQMAVDHFVRWSKEVADQKMKTAFYPEVDKADFFKLGYVAEKSGHSRGSTLDVTIIPADARAPEPYVDGKTALADCRAPYTARFRDNGLDFGTDYDCFDPKSHPDSAAVSVVARHNRAMLAALMGKHGFKPLPEEWWHFTLRDEPFPQTFFNFPIVAPQGAPSH
ncbi:MAG TPA: M15 family metallopeptidase [Azospirillum sp.]|nr:M15 family metallopeptidase [Azospirillum sp.]